MEKKHKTKALCLVSGGLDSCVAAAWAHRRYDVRFIHFSYGQRTERKEAGSFRKLCRFFNVPDSLCRVVRLPFLGQVGGSALTDRHIKIPKRKTRGVPVTYVPFRNSIMLSLAVAWAETLDVQRIVIGAVETDRTGYPDCRHEYFEDFNRLIKSGTRVGRKLRVEAPLVHLSKTRIVTMGKELGAPFHLTWSCYERTDRACSACESCRLRLEAFRKAGYRDPLPYIPGKG